MDGVSANDIESPGQRAVLAATSARDMTVTLKVARGNPILGCLPEQELLSLVRQSLVRSLPKDRVIFRNGDAGHSVVLILQGYVKLSAMAAHGREVVLEIAGPGTLFGELAVLNSVPRKADATALTATRVLAIDGTLFRSTIARTPDAMLAAIRLLSERLSAVTAQGMDAVSLPAPVRLAKVLLHLAQLQSHKVSDGTHIGVRLSQRELGAMTGLIRESINKHLKAWRAAGWIELVRGSVTLRDVAALRDYVRDHEAR
jgi:CRP/FNR family transcriptional regulator, cyclic AMP receptor protein